MPVFLANSFTTLSCDVPLIKDCNNVFCKVLISLVLSF